VHNIVRSSVTSINLHLARISAVLAGLSLVTLLLLVTLSTVARWLAGRGVLGIDELSRFLLVATVYFGATYSVASGSFLRVTLLYRAYPPRLRRWMDPFITLISVLIIGLIAYHSSALVYETFSRGIESTGVRRTPIYLAQSPVVVGLWALVLHLVLKTMELIAGSREDEHGAEEQV
jgi:TRAP-type C4-dicarboxylate transport system permease small subunit